VHEWPRFSPDGRRIAIGQGVDTDIGIRFGVRASDLWLVDVATGEPTRITTGNTSAGPSWSADGRRIAYTMMAGERPEIWSLPLDGSAPASRLAALAGTPQRAELLPDAHSFVAQIPQGPGAGLPQGLYRVWSDGSARIDTLLVSSGGGVRPTYPRVSPDGRWVAYVDRGTSDVWVQSLADHHALQISATPSDDNRPVWGPDSRHVYYEQADGMAVVELRTEPRLEVVQRHVIRGFPANAGYDLSPDGKTFVVVSPIRPSADVFVAVNWGDAARREWRTPKPR